MPHIGKIFPLDYDGIIDSPLDTSRCSFCLQQNEVEAVLGVLELLHWSTRWQSSIGTTLDQDVIDAWVSGLEVKLMSACNDVLLTRINSDGVWQVSGDGGVTWTDDPSSDPRGAVPIGPPASGSDGDDKRCAAANSVVTYFKNTVEEVAKGKDNSATLSDLTAILVGILLILGVISGGWLFAAIGALIGLIYANYDATSWRALFTDAIWESLACVLYTDMDNTGTLTVDRDGLISDINGVLADTAARQYITNLVGVIGENGLNNAAHALYGGSIVCCPTCDRSRWGIAYGTDDGTFVSEGSNYKIFHSEVSALTGGHTVAIASDDDDYCCSPVLIPVSGSWANTIYRACGETLPSYGTAWGHSGYTSQSIRALAMYGTTEFEVKVEFV